MRTRSSLSAWVRGAVVCGVIALGCDDEDGQLKRITDAGPGPLVDSGPDTGRPSEVACGTRTCSTGTADAIWGGQACCVDEARAECGVKADDPTVDDGTGKQVKVRDVLAAIQATDPTAGIVEFAPTIPCLPKNAAGDLDSRCPSESLSMGDALADGGAEDAGMSTSEPSLFEVKGCCRPDGMCGYVDEQTGFGCVRISQSLLGQVFGRTDQRCDGSAL